MHVIQQYNLHWDEVTACSRREYPTNYRTDYIVQRLREHSSFSLMIKNCHGVALFIVWTKHNDENKSITKRIGKFWMIFCLSKQRIWVLIQTRATFYKVNSINSSLLLSIMNYRIKKGRWNVFWKNKTCPIFNGVISKETSAVADPGFSRRGAPTFKLGLFLQIFCRKLHGNERISTPRGARPWRPP